MVCTTATPVTSQPANTCRDQCNAMWRLNQQQQQQHEKRVHHFNKFNFFFLSFSFSIQFCVLSLFGWRFFVCPILFKYNSMVISDVVHLIYCLRILSSGNIGIRYSFVCLRTKRITDFIIHFPLTRFSLVFLLLCINEWMHKVT